MDQKAKEIAQLELLAKLAAGVAEISVDHRTLATVGQSAASNAELW